MTLPEPVIPTVPIPHIESDVVVDRDYIRDVLLRLLSIHSPTGYTDPVTRELCKELDLLGVPYELTRRGAVRATVAGRTESPARAIVAHLDTLGAMVRELKPNGRLAIKPVGTWSSRFAEGARVSLFTDSTILRGTILPLKASGHIFNNEVDTQETSWEHVELRIDEQAYTKQDLLNLGINIDDFIGIDAAPELLPNGYINARHLDDKGGVAVMLGAIRELKQGPEIPIDMHFLFTISEEVGSGASAVLRGDVSEMVSVDNGTCGPGQESSEMWPSVILADSTGPFDYHLTRHLLYLCREHQILHNRDIFRHYRCDSASAVEAGNDIRTALVSFGVDASHGYERTHLNSLYLLTQLLIAYTRSDSRFGTEWKLTSSVDDFYETRKTKVGEISIGSDKSEEP
jgi:peptidase M42 family hydrolase